MDLNQVKSLFTATDFERGMEYYRKGRVTDMQCTKASPETNVSCTVRGSKRYTVRFTEMAEGRLRISCTCPRYADVGRCKHLAAAMIGLYRRAAARVCARQRLVCTVDASALSANYAGID